MTWPPAPVVRPPIRGGSRPSEVRFAVVLDIDPTTQMVRVTHGAPDEDEYWYPIYDPMVRIGDKVCLAGEGARRGAVGALSDPNGLGRYHLDRTKNTSNSLGFTGTEVTIAATDTISLPDKHLIEVTANWQACLATGGNAGNIVVLSITEEDNIHYQECSTDLRLLDVGIGGGHMAITISVRDPFGDDPSNITPGNHAFKLRARRAQGNSTLVVQAGSTYPTEIFVRDLGVIPADQW